MRLPRFLSKLILSYQIIDVKEWLKKGVIEIYLEKEDKSASITYSACAQKLKTGIPQ